MRKRTVHQSTGERLHYVNQVSEKVKPQREHQKTRFHIVKIRDHQPRRVRNLMVYVAIKVLHVLLRLSSVVLLRRHNILMRILKSNVLLVLRSSEVVLLLRLRSCNELPMRLHKREEWLVMLQRHERLLHMRRLFSVLQVSIIDFVGGLSLFS